MLRWPSRRPLAASAVLALALLCGGCPLDELGLYGLPEGLPVQEAAPRAQEVLDRWHAAAQARQNVYAEFKLITHDRIFKTEESVQGWFRHRRDGRLRIDLGGEEMFLFADDGNFYRVERSKKSVHIYAGTGAALLGAGLLQTTPPFLWLSSQPPDIPRRLWKLSLDGETADAVKLDGEGAAGKTAKGFSYHIDSVTVWLNKRNWLPTKAVFEDLRPGRQRKGDKKPVAWDEAPDRGGDQRSTLTVTKVETDVVFGSDDFKPPAFGKTWKVIRTRLNPAPGADKDAASKKPDAAEAKPM